MDYQLVEGLEYVWAELLAFWMVDALELYAVGSLVGRMELNMVDEWV